MDFEGSRETRQHAPRVVKLSVPGPYSYLQQPVWCLHYRREEKEFRMQNKEAGNRIQESLQKRDAGIQTIKGYRMQIYPSQPGGPLKGAGGLLRLMIMNRA